MLLRRKSKDPKQSLATTVKQLKSSSTQQWAHRGGQGVALQLQIDCIVHIAFPNQETTRTNQSTTVVIAFPR
jgi:hypothetical protein